jgi:hypothetical protein
MKDLDPRSTANLARLLQGMTPLDGDQGEALSLSTPHERVLARALGLVGPADLLDGLIPWAAWQAAKSTAEACGKGWAFITPCHWAMGREHATLTDPHTLALSAGESQTFLQAMQPYFATEGITLHFAAPDRWLAEGEVLRHLATASLDRVLGRNVDPWLPGAKTAGSLRRLQNEMQMLLYTHPLNDQRVAAGRRSVNSFWISGSGALDRPIAEGRAELVTIRTLAQAAFSDDWVAYAQAWAELDAGPIARLLARQRGGELIKLTLCGERSAQAFETAPASIFSGFFRFLGPKSPMISLEKL